MRPERKNIMLCYPATQKRVESYSRPFFIQPKLRGNRAIVEWFKGDPVLVSSYGNIIHSVPHITEQLKKFPHLPYDGELYFHDWSQEKINGICSQEKNISPDAVKLEYHIFDLRQEDKEQWERIDTLTTLKYSGHIHPVYIEICNANDWEKQCGLFVAAGYEGIIIRNAEGKYINRRSVNIAKYKPTMLDEYEILNYTEAVNEKGTPLNMIGSFIVKAKDVQEEFRVGAGKLTHAERANLFTEETVGKTLIVKHEKITTEKGIPVCCVAVKIKS